MYNMHRILAKGAKDVAMKKILLMFAAAAASASGLIAGTYT